jgi:hypothetical protein
VFVNVSHVCVLGAFQTDLVHTRFAMSAAVSECCNLKTGERILFKFAFGGVGGGEN